jgi:hypothetical protein
MTAFNHVVSWLGSGWLAVLGEQLMAAQAGRSSQVGAAGGSSSTSWEEVPQSCDMCGAAAPKAASCEAAGGAEWVWCPECRVAGYCSAACAREARVQGRHTWEACKQLGGWKRCKL